SLLLPSSLIVASCSSPSPDPGSQDPSVGIAISEDDGPQGPHVNAVTEAPTGFDGARNGFKAPPGQVLSDALDTFEEVDDFAKGIGPVFNNVSCVSCHQNPTSAPGTGSQITELRAGHFNGTSFVEHPGGSLINDRANDRAIQEHILSGN